MTGVQTCALPIYKGHKTKLVSLRDLYDCHLLLKRINKNEVLTEIKEDKKAKIYFDFMQLILNNGFNLSELDKESKRFVAKHSWYLNHQRTHYYYIKFHKTKDLITKRFFKAFVDRAVFKNLFIRITKWEWWQKRLFKGMKDYFS